MEFTYETPYKFYSSLPPHGRVSESSAQSGQRMTVTALSFVLVNDPMVVDLHGKPASPHCVSIWAMFQTAKQGVYWYGPITRAYKMIPVPVETDCWKTHKLQRDVFEFVNAPSIRGKISFDKHPAFPDYNSAVAGHEGF